MYKEDSKIIAFLHVFISIVILLTELRMHFFSKLFTVKHLSTQSYALTTVGFILLHSVFPAEVPLSHCHLVTAWYLLILPLSPSTILFWINRES